MTSRTNFSCKNISATNGSFTNINIKNLEFDSTSYPNRVVSTFPDVVLESDFFFHAIFLK